MIARMRTKSNIITFVGQAIIAYENAVINHYRSLVKAYATQNVDSQSFFIAQVELNEIRLQIAYSRLLIALGNDQLPTRCKWCRMYSDDIEVVSGHELCPECVIEATQD